MKLSYAVEARMRFIDFLLHEYGNVNRSAIVDFFGLSGPQASNDLGLYMEIAPGNMVYDMSVKSYLRTASFERKWR